MARIELSLSPADATVDAVPAMRASAATQHLDAWLTAVVGSQELCLLLDADGVVAGVSRELAQLLGQENPDALVGRGLLDDVVDFVDFFPEPAPLPEVELLRIPPLWALSAGCFAHGLVRVRVADGDYVRIDTIDVVATPLRHAGAVVGVLAFFDVLRAG